MSEILIEVGTPHSWIARNLFSSIQNFPYSITWPKNWYIVGKKQISLFLHITDFTEACQKLIKVELGVLSNETKNHNVIKIVHHKLI